MVVSVYFNSSCHGTGTENHKLWLHLLNGSELIENSDFHYLLSQKYSPLCVCVSD